eukprot:TRINITY_DN5369_c0_g1_i2.p1 TRINITY_DN5369_c0_g1~~TRINITY_DN5369_c0_g1_i2.p1  ORF type:complete len:302 (-),score=66.20 TRINITY_DN5369_c0_g1_i2:209-1114(-)
MSQQDQDLHVELTPKSPQKYVAVSQRPFKILVPVVNSPVSVNGLMYALGVAKRMNAVVHIVHCLQQLPECDLDLSLGDRIAKVDQLKYGRRCYEELQDGRALLERCQKKLKKSGLAFSLELASSVSVVTCISSVAYRTEADLIIIGTSDRSKLERVFQQTSLTKSVIEECEVPVVAVRFTGEIPKKIPELPSPFKILLAFDKRDASVAALYQAVEFAKKMNGSINLVYVYNYKAEQKFPFQEILETGESLLSQHPVPYVCSQATLPEGLTVAEHLCEMASDYDIVVIGSRSRSKQHVVFRR